MNFIYFPSFSVGNYGAGLKNNLKLREGLPYRFYSIEFPEKYRHPYFLATAGHYYKQKTFRDDWGFSESDDILLLGDSGGFQIATGAIKWKDSLRYEIFEWLENNCDIAMNLDIPPHNKLSGNFDECLTLSKENFKYFYEHQSGKVKFLNVLQGNDPILLNKWYNEVKSFDFNGWAIGGVGLSIYKIMASLMILFQNKEHYKKNNRLFHFLGISKVYHFLILSQLQKSFNDINIKIKISTDSSTPSRSTIYGDYYTYPQYYDGKWKTIHIPKDRNFDPNNPTRRKVNHNDLNILEYNSMLPNTIDFDNVLERQYTFEDFVEYNENFQVSMILHNFMLFKDVMDSCYNHVRLHPYLKEQIIGPDQFLLLQSIDEMVKAYENNTTPEIVFNKYKPHFLKMSSDESLKMSKGTIKHDFFNN